jgi:hypothetical protein
MGVSSARRGDRGDMWLAIAGAAIVFLGLAGLGVWMWLTIPPPGSSAPAVELDLGDEAMMSELERLYPTEHQQWTDETRKAVAARLPAQEIRNQRSQRTHAFIGGRILAIAAAPSEDMLAFTQISSDLEGQLRQENPQACADFAGGALWNDVPLSATATVMAGDLGAQLVRMAAAGESSPVPRDAKRIDPADATAFMTLLRKDGIPPREMRLFASDRVGEGSPDEQCDIAIRVHRAVAGLPVDQGARLQAYLLVSAWTPAG